MGSQTGFVNNSPPLKKKCSRCRRLAQQPGWLTRAAVGAAPSGPSAVGGAGTEANVLGDDAVNPHQRSGSSR